MCRKINQLWLLLMIIRLIIIICIVMINSTFLVKDLLPYWPVFLSLPMKLCFTIYAKIKGRTINDLGRGGAWAKAGKKKLNGYSHRKKKTQLNNSEEKKNLNSTTWKKKNLNSTTWKKKNIPHGLYAGLRCPEHGHTRLLPTI